MFTIVESFMGSGPEKVETLLIIAETDALEMPTAFVVFLWHLRVVYIRAIWRTFQPKRQNKKIPYISGNGTLALILKKFLYSLKRKLFLFFVKRKHLLYFRKRNPALLSPSLKNKK